MASRPCFFGGKKRPLGLLRPLMVAFGTHLTFQTVSLPRPGCVRVWKLARWVRATLEVICRRAVLGRLGGRHLGRCSFLRSLPVDFQWLTSSLIHPISEKVDSQKFAEELYLPFAFRLRTHARPAHLPAGVR